MQPERGSLPPVSCGNVAREALPWPVVYYPNLHGTFFAFARTKRATPALCACAEAPVHNLLAMRPGLRARRNIGETVRAYFPDVVAGKIIGWNSRDPFPVPFVAGLCHRCNQLVPTLRYCAETDGSPFIQQYGWYVNQAYLRLGILPYRNTYLPAVCPPELQAEIEASRAIEREFQQECDRVLEVIDLAALAGNGPREAILLRPAWRKQFGRMIELRQEASERRRALKRWIEAIVGQEFGVAGESGPEV